MRKDDIMGDCRACAPKNYSTQARLPIGEKKETDLSLALSVHGEGMRKDDIIRGSR